MADLTNSDTNTNEPIWVPITEDSNKDWVSNLLRDDLRKNVVLVEFTKKNGESRIMKCTTNFHLIPEKFHPQPQPDSVKDEKEENLQLFKVFDLEKEGWRSFNYDQITAIAVA